MAVVPLGVLMVAVVVALACVRAGQITWMVMGGSRWTPVRWGAGGAVFGGLTGYVFSPLHPDDMRLPLGQTAWAVGGCCLVMATAGLTAALAARDQLIAETAAHRSEPAQV